MRSGLRNPALLSVSLASLLACNADRVATPSEDASFSRGAVPATPGPATYEYHAGDAFLAAINPALAPAKARASNGDVIELSGSGTLSVFPKSVTGGGTFTHKDANDNVLGSGTWTATELLSFQHYGASPVPGFPATFRSGNALIRAHLTAGGGAVQLDGTLRITCLLPQTDVPGGFQEGVRLAVEGVLNFNREAGGGTVFVATP